MNEKLSKEKHPVRNLGGSASYDMTVVQRLKA